MTCNGVVPYPEPFAKWLGTGTCACASALEDILRARHAAPLQRSFTLRSATKLKAARYVFSLRTLRVTA